MKRKYGASRINYSHFFMFLIQCNWRFPEQTDGILRNWTKTGSWVTDIQQMFINDGSGNREEQGYVGIIY